MGDDFFLSHRLHEQPERCKGLWGRELIRKHALPKYLGHRPDSKLGAGGNDLYVEDDENFLFTPQTLRTALEDNILTLLQCRCRNFCALVQHGRHDSDEQIADYIKRQIQDENSEKLTVIAVLLLSGCLFALRAYHECLYTSLKEYVGALKLEHKLDVNDLRLGLFGGFRDAAQWEEDTDSLTLNFVKSVTSKLAVVQICKIEPGSRALKRLPATSSLASRLTLPFIDEEPVGAPSVGRQYYKFKFAREYAAKEYQDRTLFRKRLAFSTLEQDDATDSEKELAVLREANRLDSPNIAELLFAFKETQSPKFYINLIFDYHEYDLARILHSSRSDADRAFRYFDMQSLREAVLDHCLWKAMLDLVRTVQLLHNSEEECSRAVEKELSHIGHFDIKPANILIDIRDQKRPRLLLTDFGQAQVVHVPVEGVSGQPGTYADPVYTPPESDHKGHETLLRRSYDIWSLGCVLLEVLVVLKFGVNAGQRFLIDRRNLNGSSGQSVGTFWTRADDGTHCLKKPVEQQLHHLASDPRLVHIVNCIRQMLSIEDTCRPKLAKCLEELTRIPKSENMKVLPTSDQIMSYSGFNALMKPELQRMQISCRHKRNHEWSSLSCKLQFYREHDPRPTNAEQILLVLGMVAADRPFPWPDRAAVADELLVASSIFLNARQRSLLTLQSPTIDCEFHKLHKDWQLQFSNATEFREFFMLVTWQKILCSPDFRPDQAMNIRFKSLEINKSGAMAFKNKSQIFNEGRVQVWRTLTAKAYTDRFRDHTLAHGLRQSVSSNSSDMRTSSHQTTSSTIASEDIFQSAELFQDPFKLALFVSDGSSGGSNQAADARLIILQLGSNNIELEPPARRQSGQIVFTSTQQNSPFPIAVYEPTVAADGREVGETQKPLPGVPVSPDVLYRDIKSSGTRLKRLKISLEDEERKKLESIIKEHKII